jgi:hydroxypyruvate reductase
LNADLRTDALAIWQAGVEAVRSERLLRDAVQCRGTGLIICGEEFPLAGSGRIAVVGAGKAGAGMAAALEEILGTEIVDRKVVGWVNVPADCVRPLRKIHLHAARPAGVNEPTAAGVAGALQMIEIVSQLGPEDLCLVLLSGGGSALLPAPIPEISLADKQTVTRFLMQSGATIGELNAVRKQLSQIKGGGLARRIRAGTTRTLIISDVVGDPLDVIASGPTASDPGTPAEALSILKRFDRDGTAAPQAIYAALERAETSKPPPDPLPGSLRNCVIGNNALALSAATTRATELGYAVQSLGSANQGEANDEGRNLAERCLELRNTLARTGQPICVLSGGEPVVRLTRTGSPGKGGRNQQLALAALDRLWEDGMPDLAILSGGTDGEDGPTDAAGACADARVIAQARRLGLAPGPFLERNDAYHFFDPSGGLVRTGPTHTNVMDLRVALVQPIDARAAATAATPAPITPSD